LAEISTRKLFNSHFNFVSVADSGAIVPFALPTIGSNSSH